MKRRKKKKAKKRRGIKTTIRLSIKGAKK